LYSAAFSCVPDLIERLESLNVDVTDVEKSYELLRIVNGIKNQGGQEDDTGDYHHHRCGGYYQTLLSLRNLTFVHFIDSSADPLLDEHFCRSLGSNYKLLFKNSSEEKKLPKSSEPKETNQVT
jgi:hypothetical protein